MEVKRFPKICLQKHVTMMKYLDKDPRFNWALQVKRFFFEPIRREDLWDDLFSASLIAAKQEIVTACKEHLLRVDELKKEKTTSLMLYYADIGLSPGCQNYLVIIDIIFKKYCQFIKPLHKYAYSIHTILN